MGFLLQSTDLPAVFAYAQNGIEFTENFVVLAAAAALVVAFFVLIKGA